MWLLASEVRRCFRGLPRAFSIVIVLLLSIGIGANTIIFTVVNALLLRTLPVETQAYRYTRTIFGSRYGSLLQSRAKSFSEGSLLAGRLWRYPNS